MPKMPKRPKSLSCETLNLSRLCSIEKLQRNEALLIKKEQKEKHSIINKFLRKKDIATWFHALSERQISASISLLDRIRDDIEQGTSHRCRLALIRLGLCPLESPENVSLVLRFSKGSDLAFLWFLMELFYKNTCDNCTHEKLKYNINQRIIMTAIAHLDMITTIRELEKILPKPKVKIEKFKKQENLNRQKRQNMNNNNPKSYRSPYLQPLPKPNISTSYRKRPPAYKPVVLRFYDIYQDENFEVRNEANRWFGNPQHDFEVELSEKDKAKIEKMVKHILKDIAKNIFSNRTDEENNRIEDVKCLKHYKEKKASLRENFLKEVEQIKEHFNIKDRKKIRAKTICRIIDQEVEKYTQRLNKEIESVELQTWMNNFLFELINNVTEPEPITTESTKAKNTNQCKCNTFSYDFQHSGMPRSNEIYFNANKANKPFVFHYDKIFDIECYECPIKEAIDKSLGLKHYNNLDDYVNQYAITMWKKFVEEEYNKKEKECLTDDDSECVEDVDYNPRDSKLMDELLRKALKQMSQNPKFVLASMPEAHKHPVLKEWIKRHYGLIYTKKEREEALKVSRAILKALRRKTQKLKVDHIRNLLGSTKTLPYTCRDYFYHKSQYKVAELFHNFKISILKDITTYWLAMEVYHCSAVAVTGDNHAEHATANMNDCFFAFLPSREYDIMPFRPWDKSDFNNAFKAWEDRRKMKEAEERNKI